MADFEKRGSEIRAQTKALVLEYMRASSDCSLGSEGIRQVQIFRDCGFDWGNYESAPSTLQDYWVIALLRELEFEGKIERVRKSGPWRLL